MSLSRRRLFAFRAALLGFTALLVIATGELALRFVYRDGGRTTMGGPGPHTFVYDYAVPGDGPQRFPTVPRARAPGARRVLVFGDSITWGVGVRDWRRTFPQLLLERLNAGDGQYDMQVFAAPGRNMSGHAARVAAAVRRFEPDIVIYQWYVNDLESDRRQRPRATPMVGDQAHRWLRARSYLYYLVENRLRVFRPSGYQEYLQDAFDEGTAAWATFRDGFHRWAVHATAGGARALVFLYPQVPFRGDNPLGDIHRRILALGGSTELRYPAALLQGDVGAVRPDPAVAGGGVRQAEGNEGVLATASPLPLLPGRYRLAVRLRLDRPMPQSEVATLEVEIEDRTERRGVASDAFTGVGHWTEVPLEFDVEGPLSEIRWRLRTVAGAFLSVADVSLPVTYPRLDVIDLADRLNGFDTHVSVFDAHPNERTHAVIADVLADWVRSTEPDRPGHGGTSDGTVPGSSRTGRGLPD